MEFGFEGFLKVFVMVEKYFGFGLVILLGIEDLQTWYIIMRYFGIISWCYSQLNMEGKVLFLKKILLKKLI